MKPSELLKNPEKWTKGEFARNERGLIAGPHDKDASCWCVVGAIQKCIDKGKEQDEAVEKLLKALNIEHELYAFRCHLYKWNDAPERTYEEVKKALYKADL